MRHMASAYAGIEPPGDTVMINANSESQEDVFRFGPFELVPKRRWLSMKGRPVKIGSRALDLLVVLVENAGKVVGKRELILQVWGSVIVEDANLRVHISALRRLLGDDGVESRFIVHVARRGYIFVARLDYAEGDRVPRPTPSAPVRSALRLSGSPLSALSYLGERGVLVLV